MRKCVTCGFEKPLDDFTKNGKYYRTSCKECNAARAQKLKQDTKDYIASFKRKCCKCDLEDVPEVFDFHHINSDEKEYGLAELRREWSAYTKKLIDEEVEKCIVLCANCHRRFHFCERHDLITIKDFLKDC